MTASPDRLIWTGVNVDEMTWFATRSEFAFSVGSPYHSYRWWHRAVNRLLLWLGVYGWEWTPPDDMSVLEVFPGGDGTGPADWTTARPGDAIYADGRVDRVSVPLRRLR